MRRSVKTQYEAGASEKAFTYRLLKFQFQSQFNLCLNSTQIIQLYVQIAPMKVYGNSVLVIPQLKWKLSSASVLPHWATHTSPTVSCVLPRDCTTSNGCHPSTAHERIATALSLFVQMKGWKVRRNPTYRSDYIHNLPDDRIHLVQLYQSMKQEPICYTSLPLIYDARSGHIKKRIAGLNERLRHSKSNLPHDMYILVKLFSSYILG